MTLSLSLLSHLREREVELRGRVYLFRVAGEERWGRRGRRGGGGGEHPGMV